jgi:uncharacterized protein (TIGR00255 family)
MAQNKTLHSMTGFASDRGELDGFSWSWELRSVNAKGLDIRFRVPDWLDGLETALRGVLTEQVARGNISLSLRLTRQEESGSQLAVNAGALQSVLDALQLVQQKAAEQGVTLAPTSGADLLGVRGVLEQRSVETDAAPLVAQMTREFKELTAAFLTMREEEGAALLRILRDQLDLVADLRAGAAEAAEARKPQVAQALQTNLARVLDNSDGADPDRVAQELAMLAVKADVTEEIDRLGAHVDAARALLDQGGPVGRKLDFLMQEFNREANTLCSKAQNSNLTTIGLELKTVIDQMREQVQNIE